MSLSELASSFRVTGFRQVYRELRAERVRKVFFAVDADAKRIEPILELAREQGIEIEEAPTMIMLGRACAISRPASVAALRTTD
ncbi:MAG TPA: ribosomal L7Ae/L30e/S12e/Gadd45 family protein [Synergistales bacterium]|nr:ribosomal L7Ae/L30e/S12e/Gadd45 family protein [Synergistales bacterium]